MFNNVNTHRCFIMSMMYIRNLVGLHLKYYTDTHDVDEGMRAMTIHGDHWEYGSMAGITMRYMGYTPTYTWDGVAYKYNNKNSTPVMRVEFLLYL